MTQEEFNTLKPGDKVRIVKEKTGYNWNVNGLMDKWLGEVMTVRGNLETYFGEAYRLMEEDRKEYKGEGWHWYRNMIECKVEDAPADCLVMEREETRRIPRAVLRKRFLNELTGERGPFTWSNFGVEFTQRWDEVSLEMVMECFDRAMEEEDV